MRSVVIVLLWSLGGGLHGRGFVYFCRHPTPHTLATVARIIRPRHNALDRAHPAVAEVAAHGVTSELLEAEAELKVVVVLKPGENPSPEQLARFVNDNAPHFFVPRYIEFATELPHTPTGRVQKYLLRKRGVTPETWDAVAEGFEIKR